MSDQFPIIAPQVTANGGVVSDYVINLAFNQLTLAVRSALNTLAGSSFPPLGPAGGDLSGMFPNPTVNAVHATSGTMSGVAITGGTFDNAPIGSTTPSTIRGTSLFSSGGATPAVTVTGTQIWNGPSPTVQFIDSARSANNKNAYVTWGSTVLAVGFANDGFTGFTNALTITGGQVAGISGITSTSGTGSWAHTGGFNASGGIDNTTIGAVTPSSGSFTTLAASGAVSGTGFTNLFASPPAIGSTTPSSGSFTAISASGVVSGTGFTNFLASPPSIGSTTPNTGAFTTLTASTPVGVASGGTGRNTLTAHGVLLGEGTAAINQTAVGTTGQMLLGVTGADPAFGNNPTITGGTVDNAPVGGTTPNTGSFTNLASSGSVTGTGFTARFASPGPIGNTAASTGAFTTITATGTITPSSTNGIVGTTTNDSANVGSVGEFQSNTTNGTSLTTGTVFNATSVSLTAGDWDVSGVIQYVGAGGAAITSFQQGISTTSATFGAFNTFTGLQPTLSTSNPTPTQITPTVRISIASTTTVFLIGFASFSGGTATANGFIRARRVR